MRTQSKVVNVKVLPGEPTDGSGRVCIHLFVQDPRGPILEPHALHPVIGPDGEPVKQRVEARPTRGRLACDSRRRAAPDVRGNVASVTCRTDDPRAVTCLKCKATADYERAMVALEEQVGG